MIGEKISETFFKNAPKCIQEQAKATSISIKELRVAEQQFKRWEQYLESRQKEYDEELGLYSEMLTAWDGTSNWNYLRKLEENNGTANVRTER